MPWPRQNSNAFSGVRVAPATKRISSLLPCTAATRLRPQPPMPTIAARIIVASAPAAARIPTPRARRRRARRARGKRARTPSARTSPSRRGRRSPAGPERRGDEELGAALSLAATEPANLHRLHRHVACLDVAVLVVHHRGERHVHAAGKGRRNAGEYRAANPAIDHGALGPESIFTNWYRYSRPS